MNTKDIPNDFFIEMKKYLKKYRYLQAEINDLEEEILNNSKFDINSGTRSKNKICSTVENQAIALASSKELEIIKAWKNSIDDLLVYYINDPVKLKFLKRRYIDYKLVHYKARNMIKDLDVIKDLELEGHLYSLIQWKRWKAEMYYNLYQIVKENKIIKKYYKF